jgi:hypothetical protein
VGRKSNNYKLPFSRNSVIGIGQECVDRGQVVPMRHTNNLFGVLQYQKIKILVIIKAFFLCPCNTSRILILKMNGEYPKFHDSMTFYIKPFQPKKMCKFIEIYFLGRICFLCWHKRLHMALAEITKLCNLRCSDVEQVASGVSFS